jgi:hypothetical protein
MDSTKAISKIFFRLRRKRAIRRPRQRGHYWVLWSAGGANGNVYRIAFYLDKGDVWYITGSDRPFKDADFIQINENPVTFPWSFAMKAMTLFSIIANIVLAVSGLIYLFGFIRR